MQRDKLDRREFVKTGTVAAVAAGMVAGCSSEKEPAARTASRYQAEVPDTLDLAARGALALRAITNVADPKFLYNTCQGAHLDHQPPYMSWRTGGPCLQKPIHALPGLRMMSGSTVNPDVDARMLESITQDIEGDDLWWLKSLQERPWRAVPDSAHSVVADAVAAVDDRFWPFPHARMMVALMDWHQYDGDSKWLELTGRMADSLAKLALKKDDRAWYYQTYARSGAWVGRGVAAGRPADFEPPRVNPQDIGNALRAFSRWYVVSGDKKALDLAHRLARFMLKPTMWGARGEEMVVAGEHGRWSGHFHTNTTGLIGLAEYAIASNDARARRITNEAYQHARSVGISRIGFFPAVIRPTSQKQPSDAGADGVYPQVCKTCGVADMIALAIRLSQSGIGDYWDHVDHYVRNHLVECQMLRRDLLEEIIAAAPAYKIDPTSETDDNVLERNIGAFVSGSDPTWLYAWYTMCCQGNGSLALSEAWKAILDHSDGVVQVNLLLNRASRWVDLDSYLPYEGKVVLKNKTARKLHVRIPAWVDKKAVRCHVNDRQASPHWLNNYLIVEGLGRTDVVKVEFPVPESTEKFSLPSYGRRYTCDFKGSTLVDISPRGDKPVLVKMGSDDGGVFEVRKGYPIYLRDHLKADHAPMKTVERFVASNLV